MGNTNSAQENFGILQCCSESRESARFIGTQPVQAASSSCGIGVGLDPVLIAERKGAWVIALAEGGSAHVEGGLKIGDQIVMIDDLDVNVLMKNSANDNGTQCAFALANALLGDYGTPVRIEVLRQGKVIRCAMHRAPLPKQCKWIRI
mmetsp:Transcript_16701/g.38122  ORF Transcript_16701/g.38122 Transcript_16701/m.38122 type:complete len:148 (+) Transcript_16701:102-545(+)